MGAKELNLVQQELFEAVRRGDAQKVQNWITSRRNKRPRTPLNFLRVSTSSHSAWLCSIVDPTNGYTVLHLAALLGHKEVVKILISVDSQLARVKDRRGCLPVHLAAWNGHVEALQILIDAEPSTVDAVNSAKESPLHLSAQHGHGKVVTALLAKHADARLRNARCETALDVAARLGKANVCRLIICNCPELALQSASECMTTDPGKLRKLAQVVYPLHAAARHGHIDCLEILCHSGFDLDYVTEEGSALHVAALFGKVEAVKLLLEQGISVDTRDGQGRTVLETLAEHENEKASDLTQVIQSREGWSECRKLIEAHIQQIKSRQNKKACTENPAVYLNLPHYSKCGAKPKDIIWRPIPETSSARLQASRTRTEHSSAIGTDADPPSNIDLYHTPSIVADVITLPGGDGRDFDDISTLSLSTFLEPSEGDSGSQPSPSRIGGFVSGSGMPLFAVVSPSHKYGHGPQRNGNPLPRMGVGRVLASSDSAATCSYQAPLSYDAWRPPRVGPYDNVISPPHPLLAYDNVPRNLLVYDNAPPTGHRRWEHSCEAKASKIGGESNGTNPDGATCCSVRTDGTQTVPPMKPSRQHMPLLEKTFKPEATAQARQAKLIEGGTGAEHIGLTNGDGLTCTFSHRAESRASIATFACSTLERSASPGGQSGNVPSGTASLARGRAPLAFPEEVSVSASASILSIQNSPERCYVEKNECRRHSRSLNDESSLSDHNSATTILHSTPSLRVLQTAVTNYKKIRATDYEIGGDSKSGESDLDHLPSPETTESRIHHFLFSQDNVKQRLSESPTVNKISQHTQKGPLSPSSIVGSDCTLASSCSLPIISHVSSTSLSLISPSQECSQLCKQSSVDDQSFSSSVEVRLRTASSSIPVHDNISKVVGGLSISSGSEQRRDELDNSAQASPLLSDKVSTRQSSLNESIEWKKINEIMESFGGAICRESVFAAHYEPKVAVYLRDRRSQALTLQLSGSQALQNRRSCGCDADKRNKQPRGVNAVAQWLNVCVGIPNPRANEIAEILENNGFDSVEHMQSTLDRTAMQEIGLDKSTQHQIGMYLENYPSICLPNANSFTYVSDWLHSLDLEDYLGHFVKGGLTSMLIVFAIDSTRKHLKVLGITKLGHQKRILNSLKEAKEERRQRAAERAAAAQEEEADSGQESRSTAQSSSSVQVSHSLVVAGRQTEWQHSSSTLIEDCISYSAHYLGSMEISNVEGTEDSRRAMIKLKKGIREIAKVPHVLLEISVSGVRVLDAITKQLTVEHEITQIQIVCQDERDLNCFAYISQDGDRHFCHVFCVLTADVATEIIITLGQAFEVCYRIANNSYGNAEPVAIEPIV